MSWELSDAEYEETIKLSPEDRYGYFIDKAIEHGKVWSLRNDEGWVLGEATEEIEAIPVWPHPRYAEVCATGPWANHDAAPIDLNIIVERYVPGMMKDHRVFAVFEVVDGPALVVPADAVGEDLDISVE